MSAVAYEESAETLPTEQALKPLLVEPGYAPSAGQVTVVPAAGAGSVPVASALAPDLPVRPEVEPELEPEPRPEANTAAPAPGADIIPEGDTATTWPTWLPDLPQQFPGVSIHVHKLFMVLLAPEQSFYEALVIS